MNNGLNPCMAIGQGCGSYSGQQWGKSLVTGHVISGWGYTMGYITGLWSCVIPGCGSYFKQQCMKSLALVRGGGKQWVKSLSMKLTNLMAMACM